MKTFHEEANDCVICPNGVTKRHPTMTNDPQHRTNHRPLRVCEG